MKIAIDARLYGLENAGIGRYVMNLIEQIENLDKENQYLVLLRKKYFQSLNFKNEKFQKVLADYPHYSFLEQLLLPVQLFRLRPDLTHFPHFNVPIFWWGKKIVTIHDLIKHQSRGTQTTTKEPLFYWFKYLNYRFLIWLAVKKADRIIVPSRYWKRELARRYRLPPKKIKVTYEGVDNKFKIKNLKLKTTTKKDKILEKCNLKKPFIIYTGSLYPHKNVERLVAAVKRYHVLIHSNKKLVLAIACSRGIFYERFNKKIKEMKAERFVNLLGFVPDEDLIALYRIAEAFVLPSLVEGFGLIGLEAMACGCPVICSDIPVLREVYGKAALYFDPLDVKDIVEKIGLVINDKTRRKALVDKGKQQVKKYSWQKMAKQTLKVYLNLQGESEGE